MSCRAVRGRRRTGRHRWMLCADDVARAGIDRCCARTTSHGPARVRLGRTRNLAQPCVRRAGRHSNRSRSLLCLGASTTTCLALDSVAPPAGPPAPRLSLKYGTARYAGSRPRTGPGRIVAAPTSFTQCSGTTTTSRRTTACDAMFGNHDHFAANDRQKHMPRETCSGTTTARGTCPERHVPGDTPPKGLRAETMCAQGRRGAGSRRSGQFSPSVQRWCRGAGGRCDRVQREKHRRRSTHVEQRARPVRASHRPPDTRQRQGCTGLQPAPRRPVRRRPRFHPPAPAP